MRQLFRWANDYTAGSPDNATGLVRAISTLPGRPIACPDERSFHPKPNPFRCFNSSPEVIRMAAMLYVRFPLSLRNVEDLLFERGVDICPETVRFWWNRFGQLFASETAVEHMAG